MTTDRVLNLYVIYKYPRDYPDDFVVRRWELETPKELVGTAKTLQAARALIPPGLYNLGRLPGDELQIEEVWV